MTPVFEIFNSIGSLFHASSQSHWPPLSAEKNGLSLLHLVPEILGPKFDLIFHQTVSINFLFDFRYKWAPFTLILDLFDTLDPIGSNFLYCMLNLGTKTLGEVPPPPSLCNTQGQPFACLQNHTFVKKKKKNYNSFGIFMSRTKIKWSLLCMVW